MSTYTQSLYRPIKVTDILNLGFEFDNESDSCIKIHIDRLTSQIEYDKAWRVMFGLKLEEDNDEYFYLHTNEIISHRGHDCIWSFNRYGMNGPALDYLLQSLSEIGYKFRIEGERYNYESDMIVKNELMKRFDSIKIID